MLVLCLVWQYGDMIGVSLATKHVYIFTSRHILTADAEFVFQAVAEKNSSSIFHGN